MNAIINNECGCAVGIQGQVLHARKEIDKYYHASGVHMNAADTILFLQKSGIVKGGGGITPSRK
jgi:hypothetical protein